MLWLIAAGLLLVSSVVAIVAEIQTIEEFSTSVASAKAEEAITISVILVVVDVVLFLLAWTAYRGRVVGLAVSGLVLATASTVLHLVLLLTLVQSSGAERISVSIGPWLVAVGLAGMSLAGWLLARAAAGYRRPEVALPPTEPNLVSQTVSGS